MPYRLFLPDKNIMAKTGKVLMVSDLTNGYGMKDIGGRFHSKEIFEILL